MHIKIIVKNNLWKKKKTAQLGTNVKARSVNAGLPARSQFASRRSCDRPTRLRFSVVFLGSKANAELVPKFHVALHASHAALPMETLKISPYTNVTLNEPYTEKKVTVKQRKFKSGHGPHWGTCTKGTGRQTVGRNIT
jgi:hypothetical protein